MQSTDEALLRAARLGDADAFAELVGRHGPALYAFALRMSREDDGLAADAVQEGLVSAWTSLDGFSGRSTVRTWLFSIVHRRVVDQLRRRVPVPVDVVEEVDVTVVVGGPVPDPVELVMERELVEALQVALGELPTSQRATWLLYEIDGMSYGEVAAALSMTPDAVRGALHRARGTLRERMERWR